MPDGCVLLVDDEPALAELLKRYLTRLGYSVESCETAGAAVDLFRADPGRFSILVTDLTLPGTSGEELLLRLREIAPDLPAIISSGYPYQPASPRTEFLQKPFLPK